jgi:hypothetical protein
MAMIEALMSLFIKEVLGGGRAFTVVSRIHPSTLASAKSTGTTSTSQSQEEALLLWLNASCRKLSEGVAARLKSYPNAPQTDEETDELVSILF